MWIISERRGDWEVSGQTTVYRNAGGVRGVRIHARSVFYFPEFKKNFLENFPTKIKKIPEYFFGFKRFYINPKFPPLLNNPITLYLLSLIISF